jgi:hypothetical protein
MAILVRQLGPDDGDTTRLHALRGALMPAVEAATVAACVLSLFGGACAQAAAQIGGAPPKASLVYL